MGAETDKRRNTVNACGARAAGRCSTVINVFRAVGSTPAINTHTDVAADQVAAGASVLASVWLQATLVHIFCTVLTCDTKADMKRREKNQLNITQSVNSGVSGRTESYLENSIICKQGK